MAPQAVGDRLLFQPRDVIWQTHGCRGLNVRLLPTLFRLLKLDYSKVTTLMMSGILNQRLVLAGIAAGTLAFVSYCIYFDKKRRSHPDFKKNLRQSKPLSLRNLHVTTLTLLFINLQRGRAGRMSPKMGLVHSPI